MTTPPGGQYPPQQPQFPQQQYPPSGGGRKALPWVIGGAVLVVAALVVTLVLTLGGDNDDGGDNNAGGNSESGGAALSTPEAAAESFAAAAASGDGEALLQLTCLREMACLSSLGEDVSESDLAEAQELIRNGADDLAESLEGVEFGERTEASIPGAVEIPYTTPGSDDYHAFMFIEFEGEWLYAGDAGSGQDANPPTT